MIDTLFALTAAGQPKAAEPIVRYLDDQRHATDYYTWDGLVPGKGYDAIVTGGAAAKTLVAAEVAGRDPRSFGGHDMVAETRGAIKRSGPDAGRVSDYSKNPAFENIVRNNSTMFGQSLALIGLAGAGETDQLAAGTLVSQQCAAGYFRIFFGHAANPDGTPKRISTCEEDRARGAAPPDGDATAMALSAMLAARDVGATGLDGPIAKAVSWIEQHQDAGGGWGGGVGTETPNTNSTGLLVQALADAGGSAGALGKGVAFLKSAQVTAADAGTALANETGALAYLPSEYRSARKSGITARDTWVRASAQAALGMAQAGFRDLVRVPRPHRPGPPLAGRGSDPVGDAPKAADQERSAVPPPKRRAAGSPAGAAAEVPAQESAAGSPGERLAAYLAGQLVGGDHVEVAQDGRPYVDYDRTADVVVALRILGHQPQAAAKATAFLLSPDSIKAYAHGAPYEKGPASYAEPLAKLAIVARLQPEAGAPADLAATTARLQSDLAALRDGGLFTDIGEFADGSHTATRQSWALLATVAAGDSAGAAEAAQTLSAHQCADGLLPADLSVPGCEHGDVTATAAAVPALAARATQAPPEKLAPHRIRVLQSAVAALDERLGQHGLVSGGSGPDPASTGAVTAARSAIGLDTALTVKALSALLGADGGFAKTPGGASDLATAVAAAPGVAGHGWIGQPGSPVAGLTALPVPVADAGVRHALPQTGSSEVSPWLIAGLVASGLALDGVFLLFIRRFRNKGSVS